MHRFNALRFEATPDGMAGMAPGGGLTPDGVPHESPPEPDPVPEGPTVEDQLAQFSQIISEQQAMLEQLAPVADYMQQAPGQNGQPQEPTMPSPFDDDYGQKMEQYLEYRDQQRLGPYQEAMQAQQSERAEGLALDIVHTIEQEKGELLSPKYGEGEDGLTPQELVVQLAANVYYPDARAQFGDTNRADEMALLSAYEDVKRLETAWLAAAEEQHANQLHTLSQAPREPGSSGVAAQPAVTTVAGGWEAFKARHGLE